MPPRTIMTAEEVAKERPHVQNDQGVRNRQTRAQAKREAAERRRALFAKKKPKS